MNKLENTAPSQKVEIANRLVGPFTVEPSGVVGHTIRDNDGAIIAWVTGAINAQRVAGALNLAFDCGLLD